MAGFTVAIVGRPNVGKSTLFNRLLERRKAIVDNLSGVTRDRQYGVADWNGKAFNVIDTGGFVADSDDVFEIEIAKQVRIAMNEADLLLFMVDVATGITALDEEFAEVLRKSKKPVLLVVNKVDNGERLLDATEFYGLGFDVIYSVSSMSGSGTGELLDAVTEQIPAQAVRVIEKEYTGDNTSDEGNDDDDADLDEPENKLPKIAIIGQPNAGKSSLLNALVGEDRNIVSDIPGTTRDSIHTHYKLYNREFVLIDTAGLRKKNKEMENLEFYSVIRAIKAMDEADICLLVIDAVKGITAQDVNIFSLATRKGKGIAILVNKWDLVEKETNTARDYEQELKRRIAPFTDVPVLFISATEKQRVFKVVETLMEVYENRTRRIATSVLNEMMKKVFDYQQPPMVRGRSAKIKYVTQLPTVTPSFAFFTNFPEDIKEPYRNYLEKQLRDQFNYKGVPVRIYFRKK